MAYCPLSVAGLSITMSVYVIDENYSKAHDGTVYDYIRDHLGYRLELLSGRLSVSNQYRSTDTENTVNTTHMDMAGEGSAAMLRTPTLEVAISLRNYGFSAPVSECQQCPAPASAAVIQCFHTSENCLLQTHAAGISCCWSRRHHHYHRRHHRWCGPVTRCLLLLTGGSCIPLPLVRTHQSSFVPKLFY